jgi:osmoprotectant transport system permease protein
MSTDTEVERPPDDTATAGPEGPEGTEQRPQRRTRSRMSREQVLLLTVLPVLVLLVFGGWVWWRQTAGLDAIEARQLAWGTLGDLTWEHVKITLVTTVFVLLTAIPAGILLTRRRLRRAAPLFVGIGNIGQAAPAIGLVVLLAIWLGFGFWTAVLAFTLYGVLPVLRNTIVGLQGVDQTLVEAGRGMGMSAGAVLFRIELPLAVPVIMAGVRTALVLVVGVASFATFIDAGGLGALIQTGITLFRTSVLVSGGLLIALLALLIDWVGRVLEAVARPKGL